MTISKVIRFLTHRIKKLTAVTVTGGEPTEHEALRELLSAVRALGFRTKLDTNGMRPGGVLDLIREGLVDYTAVDIKVAPGTDGSWLTGVSDQGDRALETLRMLTASNQSCEARTTVIRGIHDAIQLTHMARCLSAAGVKTWRLQPVRGGAVLDPTVCLEVPSKATLGRALVQAEAFGLDAAVRPGAHPMVTLADGMSTSAPFFLR